MNENFSNHMREATRLTRAGRMTDASALLRHLWRSAKPGTATAPPSPDASGTAAMSPVIDMAPDEQTGPYSAAHDTATGGRPAALGAGGLAMTRMQDRWPEFSAPFRSGGSGPHLGETMHGMSGRTTVPVAKGAEFIDRSFNGDAGSRRYRLYVPSTYRGEAMPLVVMLHGCTQSPDDFAAGTGMNALAEEQGCLVAYPGQTQAANAQKCWNWFSPADQQRDRGEPGLIAGITRQVMRDFTVDARRVYVAGLSAGGAAAAIMVQVYPGLYAAAGVHSGLACGAANNLQTALAAMRGGAADTQLSRRRENRRVVPTIVFHADEDRTVHPRNGDQVIAQSAAGASLRTEIQAGQVPGGRRYRRTIHTDSGGAVVLEQWLVHGGGHAWSGGSAAGSYTDPSGPDASREMLRFFLEHPMGDIAQP